MSFLFFFNFLEYFVDDFMSYIFVTYTHIIYIYTWLLGDRVGLTVSALIMLTPQNLVRRYAVVRGLKGHK